MRETSDVMKLSEEMKTVCVGRFLIAVPGQAEVGFSNEMMDGLIISTVEDSEAVFRERLAAREAEIEASAKTHDSHGPGGIVEARDLHLSNMFARLVVYSSVHEDAALVLLHRISSTIGLPRITSQDYQRPSRKVVIAGHSPT